MHLLTEFLFQLLPEGVRITVAVLGAIVVVLGGLACAWTAWTTRRILRRALGRAPITGQELSLNMWMALPQSELDAAARELQNNPFEIKGITDLDGVEQHHWRK